MTDPALITLASDRLQVSVAPTFGARVTELRDLASGRNWLVSGPTVGSPDNDAQYLGEQARGWDECFPTVAPCVHPDWPEPLRDHGEIWGRRTHCELSDACILSSSQVGDCLFQRWLIVTGSTIHLRYRLTNEGKTSLPWMWSQHCLLRSRTGDRLFLQGVDGALQLSGATGQASETDSSFHWPCFNAERPDLRDPQAQPSAWACKAYGSVAEFCEAGIRNEQESIRFRWESSQMPFVGVWLNHGAWPADKPVHQLAFEPTTAPADDLNHAALAGHARWLPAGQEDEWTLTIQLNELPGRPTTA
ncbi:hypothetical protein ACUNV4_09700 [Granulosicoccus sp. 3-233]|uniref:hypothetical protein n=1 Tax=Granulosicoccus sp. 3-233 TaxID=3417969 RepID=UPI003D3496A3